MPRTKEIKFFVHEPSKETSANYLWLEVVEGNYKGTRVRVPIIGYNDSQLNTRLQSLSEGDIVKAILEGTPGEWKVKQFEKYGEV